MAPAPLDACTRSKIGGLRNFGPAAIVCDIHYFHSAMSPTRVGEVDAIADTQSGNPRGRNRYASISFGKRGSGLLFDADPDSRGADNGSKSISVRMKLQHRRTRLDRAST